MVRTLFIALIAAVVHAGAWAEFPKAYVGYPDARDLALSPDGSEVVVLMTDYEFGVVGRRTWDNLEFLNGSTGDTRYVHDLEERTYLWVYWPFQDALITQALIYDIGRRDVDIQPTLLAINPLTGEETTLYKGKRQDWEKDFDVPKIAGFSEDTREVAVLTSDKNRIDLVAINVDTGKTRRMARGNSRTLRWSLNDDFEPIIRFDRGRDEAEEIIYVRDKDGKWRLIERVNKIENEFIPNTNPDEENALLVLHRPDGAERAGLYEYDLAQQGFGDLVFQHPEYDLISLRSDRKGYVLYTAWAEDGFEKKWLNPSLERFGRMLDKAFKPNDNWTIVETSEDSTKWLLYVSSPTRPGSFFHFDTETKKANFLVNRRPELKSKAVSDINRVDYKARDGLDLVGYFTPSKRSENAPLIVFPHGGPVSRDYIDFNGYAQFLAFRGYHVFQPQFRGGGGRGQSFERAGHGEWGRAMQTDIEDGVKALIGQGLYNREAPRSIFGVSYGGYAALAGASLTPDTYQCAVSVNGVSDLPLFFKQYDPEDAWDREALKIWSDRIGDPETDLEAIKAISPINHVEQIKIPILLIHGDRDSVVYPIQSDRMYEALERAGKSVRYHELEGQGHYIYNEDERVNALVYIDNFFMGCMPPVPVAASPEASESVQ
ncbi:MAG: prolyl oligopeptidase family serine peptidase [Pseudomonadota bacterium]